MAAALLLTACSSGGAEQQTDGGNIDSGTKPPADGGTATGDQGTTAKDGGAPEDGRTTSPDVGGSNGGTGGSGGQLGAYVNQLSYGQATWKVAFYVPSSYNPAKPAPALLHFHGWRPAPAGVADEITYVWKSIADQTGMIVAAPEGQPCPELNPNGQPFACFRESRDGAFVKSLVQLLGSKYNLDPKRTYLSGHSGGAFFVQGFALLNASSFAAAVGFSGGCISDSDQYGNSCAVYQPIAAKAARKIPYYIAHNAVDQVVPVQYSANLINLVLKPAGNPVQAVDTYNGGDSGHSIDPAILPGVWNFLKGYSLP